MPDIGKTQKGEGTERYPRFDYVISRITKTIMMHQFQTIVKEGSPSQVSRVTLFLLYAFSYCKQVNEYVVKNIDEVNNKEQ